MSVFHPVVTMYLIVIAIFMLVTWKCRQKNLHWQALIAGTSGILSLVGSINQVNNFSELTLVLWFFVSALMCYQAAHAISEMDYTKRSTLFVFLLAIVMGVLLSMVMVIVKLEIGNFFHLIP